MKNLITAFPEQLEQALAIGKKISWTFAKKDFDQVYVCGLGGSGIGATIVQEYAFDKFPVPFTVSKEYRIAKSVTAKCLFIACSYSGNTEETIEALHEAIKRKATIVCITSGGDLEAIANKRKLHLVKIPEGMPPRACIGYSLVQLLFVLKKAGLMKENFESQIAESIEWIRTNTKKAQSEAKKLAKGLHRQQIAIYTLAGYEGLAVRFQQQLQENSKVLCWHNVIPEMTHNEIVGWREEHRNVSVVFALPQSMHAQNAKRVEVMKSVVKKYKAKVLDITIADAPYFVQVFSFIHLTDWVSVFLADLNNQVASEIDVINHLKSFVAKK